MLVTIGLTLFAGQFLLLFFAFKQGMPPAELANIVFDHIRRERLYILTHDNFNEMVGNRTKAILSGENPQRAGIL